MSDIKAENRARIQRWDIFRMLRSIGWEQQRGKDQVDYHAPRQGWGPRVYFTAKTNGFSVQSPHAWPWLLDGLNVQPTNYLPVTTSRFHRCLGRMISAGAEADCEPLMVGRGLVLYQYQFDAVASNPDLTAYEFVDCVRLVQAHPGEEERLRELVRTQVPTDVVDQVRRGELSPRFVVDLYVPRVPDDVEVS